MNEQLLHELMEEYFQFKEELEDLYRTEEFLLTNKRIMFVKEQLIKLRHNIEREGGYIYEQPRPDY